jgi:hypothetical protein
VQATTETVRWQYVSRWPLVFRCIALHCDGTTTTAWSTVCAAGGFTTSLLPSLVRAYPAHLSPAQGAVTARL